MRELYNIEEILLQILPKQNEYFLPIALYFYQKNSDYSFLLRGSNMTYNNWIASNKPKKIVLKSSTNIASKYNLLWNIDILSEPTYLFSKKISGQGYNLLLEKCILSQVDKLNNRIKELEKNTGLYKYTSIVGNEFFNVFSDIEKFIEANPLLENALKIYTKNPFMDYKISKNQKLEDILRPVVNKAFIPPTIKKVRSPYVEPSPKETTPVKESKNTRELKKSKLDSKITKAEARDLLKSLEDRNYIRKKADNLIIQNKSFSNYSSEYLKKNFSIEVFNTAFDELKLKGRLEYSKFVLLTEPPSKWYETQFINSFIFHCNHSKGRYFNKKNKKRFRYNKKMNIDGKYKKCFLLIKT